MVIRQDHEDIRFLDIWQTHEDFGDKNQ